MATRKTAQAKCETKPTKPVIEAKPGRLTKDRTELIARKKLAGAGRREEAGTAFGSRWTQAERDELQALLDEHGREKAIADFVAAHPHRTANGAAYQIDRNLRKRVVLATRQRGPRPSCRGSSSSEGHDSARPEVPTRRRQA